MSACTPLLAAGFVNPALLGGLALAIVPIIIHLLSRRRFRRIEWAAMRFLLEAERENRRRVRFEQWLLVALRCGALALLALLLARPFVQPGLVTALLGGGGQVQRIVVLDDSASLAYGVGPQREFDDLRAATLRLLSWLHQEAADDPVTFYVTSQPDQPLVAQARLTDAGLDDLHARLERMSPANVPARPRRVLARVADELAIADRQIRADIYVLSDFQRADWTAQVDRLETGPTRSAFEPLVELDPAAVRVVLIASGAGPRGNVAVIDLGLERPQTVAGLPAIVTARLANYSGKPLRELLVQVEVDGSPLPQVPVEPIPPGQAREVSLEVTFPEQGYRVLSVGVGSVDAFPADNTRLAVVHAKDALAVLVVNGQPDADPQRDEVYLLRNALAPPGPFSSGLRVEVIGAPEIDGTDLAYYDCIVLCNVAAPAPGAVAALERYVRVGGGLVFFLGTQVGEAGEYNRVLHAAGQGLLPLPLSEPVEASDQPGGVGLIRAGEHPVTAMFPAGGDSLGGHVHFWRYYRCAEALGHPDAAGDAVESDAGAQRAPAVVLARYADRGATPAIVERAFGRGRVVLFTSTVDLEWNDWARAVDGSYVVTLLELVQYVCGRDEERRAYVAGEPVRLLVRPDVYEPVAVIKSPAFPDELAIVAGVGDREARAAAGESGERVVLEGPPAMQLGTYEVELTRRIGGVESRPLCVNLDPTESDLARARRDELNAALGGVPHEFVQAGESFPGGDQQARRELWPGLLLVLGVVLLAEQGLAWWFGRPIGR
ncbi:MAG TPA: BatA domain-containing protein [Phycisphaerae bacterium]|nr:BatA domain-containing protein [Phycisphaerae bacterium]